MPSRLSPQERTHIGFRVNPNYTARVENDADLGPRVIPGRAAARVILRLEVRVKPG